MKKNRILGLLLAAAMTLGMSVPALAYDPAEEPVRVTIQSGVRGGRASRVAQLPTDITTYNAYQLMTMSSTLKDHTDKDTFGHGEDGDHDLDCYNISYMPNDKYRDIMLAAMGSLSSKPWTEAPTLITTVTEDNLATALGTVTSKSALAQEFADAVYTAILADTTTYTPDDTIDSTTVTSLNGGQGYWLFADNRTLSGDDQVARSLILLATKGEPDLVISPKTSVPTLEKKVGDGASGTSGLSYDDYATAGIGDTVSFRITAGSLPVGQLASYDSLEYTIHDTYNADELEADLDNMVVMLGSTQLTAGTAYEVDENPTDGCSFHITMDLKDLTGLTASSTITVTYDAEVLAGADIGNDGNQNTAYLEYDNDPYDDTSTGRTPDDTVAVFVFDLEVIKIAGNNPNAPLSGATFILSRGTGSSQRWATVDTNNNNKLTGWVTSAENATLLTTGNNGTITFSGLDAGTYFLTETAAPEGYNRLTSDVTIVITPTITLTDEVPSITALTVTADGKSGAGTPPTGTASVSISNSSGTELPETGGIGTTIFYVAGGALVIGAIVLFITKRRMGKEEH